MGLVDRFRKPKPGDAPKEETPQAAAAPQEGKEQAVFFFWLLFDRAPELPDPETVEAALTKRFGPVKSLGAEGSRAFAVPKYMARFQEGQVPAEVLMFAARPFQQEELGPMERGQLWNVPDAQALLDAVTHKVMIADMMAVLDYPQRCELLMDYLEAAVELFPDCLGVWVPTAGKLFTAGQVREHGIPRKDRFVYFAVNARLFNVEGGEDKVVDTLGMYAVSLPDVQYHFRGLDPNAVVNHAYNLASYQFDHHAPIQSGETVDGLEDGAMSQQVQWRCQYENALIQPQRTVLDVCPGPYAAGGRG